MAHLEYFLNPSLVEKAREILELFSVMGEEWRLMWIGGRP